MPLQWDLIAGLSVGAMVVPSGLSYAAIAGLPAVMGLYGAFVPCIVYCLFGNSRQLSVGPVAVTSLLIGNGMAEVLPGAPRSCLYLMHHTVLRHPGRASSAAQGGPARLANVTMRAPCNAAELLEYLVF